MIHPYTCAFCNEEIDKRAQVKVTTTQSGTLKFYHVAPDCMAAEKMRNRLEQYAEAVNTRVH